MTTKYIDSLTPEQEKLLDVFWQEGKDMAIRTKPMNLEKVTKAVDFWYGLIGVKTPKILTFDSPKALNEAINADFRKINPKHEDEFHQSEYSNIWSAYYMYYKYVLEVLFPEEKPNFKELLSHIENLKEVHYIVPFDTAVYISEFPIEVNYTKMPNGEEVPHSTTGPSIGYKDGSGIYNLWGIKVPKWLITTPKNELDVKEILKIKNVEQRLVALKFIGPAKMLSAINAQLLDKKYKNETELEYELFSFDLNGTSQRLLKMKNPSVDETHYEYVEPSANTVNEALAFRRNRKIFVEPIAKT